MWRYIVSHRTLGYEDSEEWIADIAIIAIEMTERRNISAQRGFEWVDCLLEQISEHEKDHNLAPLLPFLRPLNKSMLPFLSLDTDQALRGFAWNI